MVSKMSSEEDKTEIFFLTPENRWIRYTKYYGHDPADGTPYISKDFEECFPEQVAYTLLWEKVFGDELPEELNSYRQYGDIHVFSKWRYENRDKIYGRFVDAKFILPRYDGNCLMYGNDLCKRFTRKAPNQQRILEDFQSHNWQKRIKDPFNNQDRLKQTIKDMNEWKDSLVKFMQEGKGVCWIIKKSERMSPKTS